MIKVHVQFMVVFVYIFSQLVYISANTRLPVVAILAVPKVTDKAYVDASITRWLEASGAESVVMYPWVSQSEIDDILSKVNGVIFQDSDIPFEESNPYLDTANNILESVIKLADHQGVYIPIFGISHGFQVLQFLTAGENIFGNFKVNNRPIPLSFDFNRIKTTRLFSLLVDSDLNDLSTKPVTAHFHDLGVEPVIYEKSTKLRNFFRITTTALDDHNNPFITSIEAYNYPIFGVQFQPEVISFNRREDWNIPNGNEAIRISRAIGNFFVQECKNGNKNELKQEEYKKYNYINPYETFPTRFDNGYFYVYQKITPSF